MSETHHQTHLDDNIEIDDGGWLHGPGVYTVMSQRDQALAPQESHVLGIVWHYTDTRSVGARNLAQRIMSMPTPPQRAASWHVVIDRAGSIAQSVSALRGSWHAGGATAARFGVAGMENGHRVWGLVPSYMRERPNANSLFFGMELENVGEVRLVAGQWLGWPFKHGAPSGEPMVVPESEVHVEENGKAYHTFSDPQVAASGRVMSALAHKYNLLELNCRWSHQSIDPENRTDPGPLWMGVHLPDLCSAVFGSK